MEKTEAPSSSALKAWIEHLRNGRLRAAFAVGFAFCSPSLAHSHT
jgi:hypothetical protein